MEAIVWAQAAAFMGAAISMGLGSIGPAIGQGMIGMKACESIGKYPESANKVRTVMFISISMVETSALYCLLIAGVLLWIGIGLGQ